MGSYSAAGISLKGQRRNNQDRWLALTDQGSALLVVSDGLGGHPKGDAAAEIFVTICRNLYQAAPKPLDNPSDFFRRCIREAHQVINLFGTRQSPPVKPRTTAVVALIQDGVASWAHVGDSRLYLLHDGEIISTTEDHARVLRVSANDHVIERTAMTRCLGGGDHPPAASIAPARKLNPGDTLLLCTDGLWNQLPPQRLSTAFKSKANVDQELNQLASEAASNPKSDNVTAVALQWREELAAVRHQSVPQDPGLDDAVACLSKFVKSYEKRLKKPEIEL